MAVLNGVDERTRLLSSTPSFRREIEEEEEAINGILKVEWEGPHDPKNPKNWRPVRKWTCCMLVSLYSLIAPTASSMVVPAMPTLSQDLGITSATMTQLTLSVFVLGWGIGPVFMGPLSEMFGRAPVLHLGQLGFLIVNALCGVTTGPNTFFFFRLCSGILGSGPMSLGAGVLSDLWVSDERGMSLAIYTVMPLLGPTAGPVLGGIIVQYRSWREIFFICSLFTGACLTLGLIILPETFPPILLHRKRVALLKTGAFQDSKLLHSSRREKFHKLLTVELPRPFILLGTQPIVQTLALYMGLLFGLNHLTISTFHALWRDIYHESDLIGSLNYISISLGFLFGCQVAGPMNDKIYGYLKKRNNNTDLPEYRIWLMIPASLLVPIGLLWYGWSAAYKLHWLMPNIGILIYSFGLIIGYQCIQAYALDCYPVYAASAMGALTVLRAFAGFSLPLVAPAMYRVFGYGWSSTVLAGIALVVGGGAPWLLSVKGPMLRAKSPYAAGDVKLVL